MSKRGGQHLLPATRVVAQPAALIRRGSLIAIAFMAILLHSMGQGFASETLSQTSAWLVSNLPGFAVADDGFENVTYEIKYSFNGCNLNVVSRASTITSTDPAQTTYYTVDAAPRPGLTLYAKPEWAAHFTPVGATGKIGEYGLIVHSVFRLANIDLSSLHVRSFSVSSSVPENNAAAVMAFGSKVVSIGTTDPFLAQQSLKALRHVAAICGARASDF
jgi:hypothetical protein